MPYREGARLPAEHSSRLAHLDVLQSPLVKRLCESFEKTEGAAPLPVTNCTPLPTGGEPLPIVFAVDGSTQPIMSEQSPYRHLAFIKTALLRLDTAVLDGVDQRNPHPFVLRDIMKDAAL